MSKQKIPSRKLTKEDIFMSNNIYVNQDLNYTETDLAKNLITELPSELESLRVTLFQNSKYSESKMTWSNTKLKLQVSIGYMTNLKTRQVQYTNLTGGLQSEIRHYKKSNTSSQEHIDLVIKHYIFINNLKSTFDDSGKSTVQATKAIERNKNVYPDISLIYYYEQDIDLHTVIVYLEDKYIKLILDPSNVTEKQLNIQTPWKNAKKQVIGTNYNKALGVGFMSKNSKYNYRKKSILAYIREQQEQSLAGDADNV